MARFWRYDWVLGRLSRNCTKKRHGKQRERWSNRVEEFVDLLMFVCIDSRTNIMSSTQKLVLSIIDFLNKSIEDGTIKQDDREGLEVAS